MGLPHAEARFDMETYLVWEATQTEKHEYHRGEVFAMVGARLPHQQVSGNAAMALRQQLRGTAYRVYMSGTKLHIAAADAVLYPDVIVSCDARDRGSEDRFLAFPALVVEVLSESTAAYDRGAKFALYRTLETLREYLIVDPDSRRVELFRRGADGHWVLHDFTDAAHVDFSSIDVSVAVAELFEDLDKPQT
jgi:Uma2 family endonuclease